MKHTITSVYSKNCGRCNYWGGLRDLDRSGQLVSVESTSTKGKCHCKESSQHARSKAVYDNCAKYQPWSLLKFGNLNDNNSKNSHSTDPIGRRNYSSDGSAFGGILILATLWGVIFAWNKIVEWYQAHKIAIWIGVPIVGILFFLVWLGSRMPEKPADNFDDIGRDPDDESTLDKEPKTACATSVDQWSSNDPFAILGLPNSSNRDQVKEAFHKLIAMYHPDRVASAAPEIQSIANDRSKKINWAYAECIKVAPIAASLHQQPENANSNETSQTVKIQEKTDKLSWLWKTPLYLISVICFGFSFIAWIATEKTNGTFWGGMLAIFLLANLLTTLPAVYLSRLLKRRHSRVSSPSAQKMPEETKRAS